MPRGTSVMTSTGLRSVRWSPRPRKKSDSSPVNIRWYSHSRYAAASVMTSTATAAYTGHATNEPWKTRNSPTKPASPGRPMLASMKKPKAAA